MLKTQIKNQKYQNRNINKNKKMSILKGGTKLGQGSYGCVITPPIDCLTNKLLRKPKIEKNESYISKIIDTKYSEVAFSELNIGSKLLSIDNNHNFLVPFINACYFTHQKHPDIIYLKNNGRHISSSPDNSNISNSIMNDDNTNMGSLHSRLIKDNKGKCILNNNTEYISLFGINAGDNMSTLLNLNNNNNKILFIKNNYWYVFSYMIKGLSLLHSKNIIHKDIKPSNMVASFDYLNKTENDLPLIKSKYRYIDFGLSIHLNRRKYSMSDINELFSNGTHYYTPLEIFAVRVLNKLIKQSRHIDDSDFEYLMNLKTDKIFQKNRDYYHYEGIRNNTFKSKNDSMSNRNYYLTPLKYENIIKHIVELYKNNQLENKIPELLKSWDIYSLGITFAKIIIKCDIHDQELNNIILKMIDLNFEKRINMNQLIKIKPYISNITNSSIKLDY
jgi:serine/threonine protein kinase